MSLFLLTRFSSERRLRIASLMLLNGYVFQVLVRSLSCDKSVDSTKATSPHREV